MNLQILVSTMHQVDFSLLERMCLPCAAVVVNQCDCEGEQIIPRENGEILWIDTKERGLSNSRNMALRHAQSDICLLADDDELFDERTVPTIIKAFEENPEIAIISFQVERIEKEYHYTPKQRRRSWLGINRCNSVEIAFRRQAIQSKNIEFHPAFGSGAKYSMGEENIFLWQCLSKKLSVLYYPKPIARLHSIQSSWFSGFHKQYFFDKGAVFAAMSRFWSPFLNLQYALRKRKLSEEKFSPPKLFQIMMAGRKDYLHAQKNS